MKKNILMVVSLGSVLVILASSMVYFLKTHSVSGPRSIGTHWSKWRLHPRVPILMKGASEDDYIRVASIGSATSARTVLSRKSALSTCSWMNDQWIRCPGSGNDGDPSVLADINGRAFVMNKPVNPIGFIGSNLIEMRYDDISSKDRGDHLLVIEPKSGDALQRVPIQYNELSLYSGCSLDLSSQHILTPTFNHVIRIDVKTGNVGALYTGATYGSIVRAYKSDRIAIFGLGDNRITPWHPLIISEGISPGTQIRTTAPKGDIDDVAWSPNGNHLVVASRIGVWQVVGFGHELSIIDSRSGNVTRKLPSPTLLSPVVYESLAWYDNPSRVVAVTNDGGLWSWDMEGALPR